MSPGGGCEYGRIRRSLIRRPAWVRLRGDILAGRPPRYASKRNWPRSALPIGRRAVRTRSQSRPFLRAAAPPAAYDAFVASRLVSFVAGQRVGRHLSDRLSLSRVSETYVDAPDARPKSPMVTLSLMTSRYSRATSVGLERSTSSPREREKPRVGYSGDESPQSAWADNETPADAADVQAVSESVAPSTGGIIRNPPANSKGRFPDPAVPPIALRPRAFRHHTLSASAGPLSGRMFDCRATHLWRP